MGGSIDPGKQASKCLCQRKADDVGHPFGRRPLQAKNIRDLGDRPDDVGLTIDDGAVEVEYCEAQGDAQAVLQKGGHTLASGSVLSIAFIKT